MPIIFACVGSREVSPEESKILRATAAALVKRGALIRSGGAVGADTDWAFGGASIDPQSIQIALPNISNNTPSRVPKGAIVRLPPYPDYIESLARAEWELGDKLKDAGLPPYDPASSAGKKFTAAKSWAWLVKEKPHVAELMTRNADIIAGDPAPTAVLACFDQDVRRGGGTGHGWRLAKALGLPVFNLRLAEDQVRFKDWCVANLPSKKAVQSPTQKA